MGRLGKYVSWSSSRKVSDEGSRSGGWGRIWEDLGRFGSVRARFSSRLKVGGRSSWLNLEVEGCGDDDELDGAEGDASCAENETGLVVFSGFDCERPCLVMDPESSTSI